MPKLSVHRLLTVMLAVASILPLAVFTVIFWSVLRSHLDSDIGATTQAVLRAVSAQTAARVLEEPMRALPSALMISGGAGGPGGLRLILRAAVTPRPEFAWMAFLDRSNRVEASYPDGLFAEGEIYVPRAPQSPGMTAFSSTFSFQGGSGSYIEVSYSSAARTVLAIVDLAGMSSKLVLLALSPLDRLAVVDGSGRYLLCSDPSRVGKKEALPAAARAGGPARFSDDGGAYYVSTTSIPGSDWRAVYFRARAVADAPMRDFLLRVVVLAAAALVASGALAYLTWRSVSRPLAALLARIELMSQGRYTERVAGDFAQEFQKIAESFNTMADSIERRDREIQLSEERYRLLFDRNKAPALLIDSETGAIRDANRAALEYYGYGEPELKRLRIWDIDASSRQGLLERLSGVAPGGRSGIPARHRLKSGEERDVEVYVGPIEYEGRPYLHAIVFDVTERRIAEERTIAALEEKTLLLREVHHRVKNNLQVIMSLLSMQSDSSGDPKAVEALRSGQDRVQAMALAHELVYQMNDLASIDLAEYSERIVQNLAAAYGQSWDSVALELAPLRLDLGRAIPLGLALNELVSNAFKYASPALWGGRILVTSSLSGNGEPAGVVRVLFTVEDQGPGMRADSDEGGRSLGLTLVKALLSQIGGVSSWSTPESGRGTRVELSFPMEPRGAPSPREGGAL